MTRFHPLQTTYNWLPLVIKKTNFIFRIQIFSNPDKMISFDSFLWREKKLVTNPSLFCVTIFKRNCLTKLPRSFLCSVFFLQHFFLYSIRFKPTYSISQHSFVVLYNYSISCLRFHFYNPVVFMLECLLHWLNCLIKQAKIASLASVNFKQRNTLHCDLILLLIQFKDA